MARVSKGFELCQRNWSRVVAAISDTKQDRRVIVYDKKESMFKRETLMAMSDRYILKKLLPCGYHGGNHLGQRWQGEALKRTPAGMSGKLLGLCHSI